MCEGLDFNPSHIDQRMRMSVSNPHRGQATSLQINKVKDEEKNVFTICQVCLDLKSKSVHLFISNGSCYGAPSFLDL